MTEKINAFHKDYVRTYMPEFLTNLRTESAQHASGVANGAKAKATRESKIEAGKKSIAAFPKTQKTKRVSLERKKSFIINYEKA
jgi:hypothetical protein